MDPVPATGPGVVPSLSVRPAELVGPDNNSRRFPRWTSANAGGNAVSTSNPNTFV
ncbi:MAG: hypothetical protein R2710_22775 [Acidimicrobiales bacterium]